MEQDEVSVDRGGKAMLHAELDLHRAAQRRFNASDCSFVVAIA